MQTILGSGGVIARELSTRLPTYTDRIRQVSRSPKPVNPTDDTRVADLLDARSIADAVAGSEVVYLTVGLKYDTKVWQQQWPRIMRNVIDACARHGSKLVFFDNVYAYGLVDGPMTEDTPYNPCSRKGEVRARIATMLLEAVGRAELQGMIVRAADFYGPAATLSVIHSTVIERLKKRKTPQWLVDATKVHTFTHTPDAADSVAVLGNTPSAYGQTWHALTSKDPINGERFVRIASDVAEQPYRLQVVPRWMLRLTGLVVPVLRENMEMLYQFEYDYRFDSTKLERAFNLRATDYREGIAATLQG